VPSKRQPAKQRRAAENRAKRAALAARTERASQPRATSTSGSSRTSGSSGSRSRRGGAPTKAPGVLPEAGLGGGLAGWKEWFGFGASRPRGAGVLAALIALVAAVVAYIGTPFLRVSVDDRDEVLPAGVNAFRGLYLETRSYLTGHEVTARSISALDAQGPGLFLILAVPLLVVVGTVVAFRRTGRSLPLTIGMLVLAVLVLLLGFTVFLAAMIALAVASFQVRKVEMAERMAERAGTPPARRRRRDEPPDEEEPADEVQDEYVDDEDLDDEEYDEYEDLDDEDLDDEDLDDEDLDDEEYDEYEDEDEVQDEYDEDVEADDEDLEAGDEHGHEQPANGEGPKPR
jgi:hypothetical protein